MEYQLDRTLLRETLVHVDLDVLDPEAVGWANEFPSRGGFTTEALAECMGIAAHGSPVALTIASFMPGLQGSEAVEAAAIMGISHFFEKLSKTI